MCGIAGYTGQYAPELVQAMCRRLRHRGPDDAGFFITPAVALAMRRLAIVDPRTGRQPICNETDDVWVVFNGEIYNHAAIRRHLQELGHTFRTDHSDTEVVVHAYEQYGPLWPEVVQANGMFGLAIWDARQNRLLLYRDRMGKKPLYYANVGGQLVFGSEIKALLLHPEVSKACDHAALYNAVALKNTSAPATVYRDIRQLPPGCLLDYVPGGTPKITPYWRLDCTPADPVPSLDEAAGQLFSLYESAVALRMDCDAPYGAYLSGGVDSSAVVALMRRRQDTPIVTFCLGYADLPEDKGLGKSEDIRFARLMADRLGTEHHEFIIDAGRFAAEMPHVLAAFDEPFAGTVSTYFLSICIKDHVKVALSGDGADEIFGSYLSHRLAGPLDAYLRLAAAGKAELAAMTEGERRSLAPFDTPEAFAGLRRAASPQGGVWRDNLGVFSRDELGRLFTPAFRAEHGLNGEPGPYPGILASLTARDPLNRALETDQRELLPNQVLPFVDRLSMAHSIEVRCPYLDHRIVAYANSLPGSYKIRNGINKYIQKRALAGVLPEELINRPKEGFVQPIYAWMHGPLKGFVRGHVASLPDRVFDQAFVGTVMDRFETGDQTVNAKVWTLACCGMWLATQPIDL
ncbi:asparagine synthase (glutamine-hydrolyzing) [Solidesulfovibrio sp.]